MRRACAALLDASGQVSPPVRLKSLMGILAVPWDFNAIAKGTSDIASIQFARGELKLQIDRRSFGAYPQRARFSIAHEIGHLIIYRALGPDVFDRAEIDEESYKEVEELCDFAASHLLLPRAQLMAVTRGAGLTNSGVRRVCRTFDVSEAAALRAMADLFPQGAILDWRKFRRHARERYEWRVWKTFRPTDAIADRPWLPAGCTGKHLPLGINLDSLAFNVPRPIQGVELVLGRSVHRYDAVVAKLNPNSLSQFLPMEEDPEKGLPQTLHDDGRLLIVVGTHAHSDLNIFMGPQSQ